MCMCIVQCREKSRQKVEFKRRRQGFPLCKLLLYEVHPTSEVMEVPGFNLASLNDTAAMQGYFVKLPM